MTKQEIEAALDSGKLEVQWRSGKWYTVRRNGATKLWKRNPERFATPCKTGFRDCFTIAYYDSDCRAKWRSHTRQSLSKNSLRRANMNANNIRKLIRLIASRQVNETGESTWQTKKGKFTWNFDITIASHDECSSVGCLVGLAYASELIPDYGRNEITTFTGLDYHTVARVFYDQDYYLNDDQQKVTPEMVSRELEELLISSAK